MGRQQFTYLVDDYTMKILIHQRIITKETNAVVYRIYERLHRTLGILIIPAPDLIGKEGLWK